MEHSVAPMTIIPSKEFKSMETLETDSKTIVPSLVARGVGKKGDPYRVPAPKVQLPSSPAALLKTSGLMQLPELLLDKVVKDTLEWADLSGHILARV